MNFRPDANNAAADIPIQDDTKLSNEDLDQFRNLVHNKERQECQANLIGNVSLLLKASVFEWIINSGATYYVTSCKNMLHDLRSFGPFNSS